MTQETQNTSNKFLGFAVLVLAFLGIGLWSIIRFASAQADQDMTNWKERLNLVAESRSAEASAWLNKHLATVEEIAGDASVELYVSELGENDNPTFTEGQRGYVFSLLSTEAERSGFHEKLATDTVAANVKRPRRAGLAIVNAEGIASVMTTGMPLLQPNDIPLTDAASFIALGPALSDKSPLVIFGARIVPTNGSVTKETASWVIGARPLDGDFLQTLVQPGDLSTSSETYLVISGENALVVPITPLKGGGKLAFPKQDEAARFAINQPGGFDIKQNYNQEKVLVIGKELTAPVAWTLVHSIRAKEVLSEITARRNNLIITLTLAVLFVLAGLVLVWRHGVSKRLEASYAEQHALLDKNQTLSAFLQAVSDAQPSALAAVDKDMTVRFLNQKMAEVTNVKAADLQNRRLDTAFANNVMVSLKHAVSKAIEGKASTIQLVIGDPAQKQVFKTNILPLEAGEKQKAPALIVMQDISDLLVSQAQTETLYHQLIGTLTEIIDARDPWSTFHSSRVAEVASTIAREIELPEDECQAVQIAGQLVNIGKIFVSKNILTKEGSLSDDELALVRNSMYKGAGLIGGLDFKGPVARTVSEIYENWDGTGGPNGLKGEEICPGSRILSVANAFVGMVSSRAHRPGLGFDKALDILQKEAGKRYERRAVATLQFLLETKGKRDEWEHFKESFD